MIVRQLVERTSLGQRFMRSRRRRQMDQDADTWEAASAVAGAGPAQAADHPGMPRSFVRASSSRLTFRGDMVYAVREAFPVIHSIELSESLYAARASSSSTTSTSRFTRRQRNRARDCWPASPNRACSGSTALFRAAQQRLDGTRPAGYADRARARCHLQSSRSRSRRADRRCPRVHG